MEKGKTIKWSLVMVAIVVVAFAGIKIFGSFSPTGNVVQNTVAQTGDVKEFNVKAFRFGYTPDEITVNKGDKVRINIENTDVLHGIRIPELNLREDESLEFTADKAGEFIWYCANMCGTGHMQMKGKLTVK